MTQRVKIYGTSRGRALEGRDLRVSTIDALGHEVPIPARAVTVHCDGPDLPVQACVVLDVTDIDIDAAEELAP